MDRSDPIGDIKAALEGREGWHDLTARARREGDTLLIGDLCLSAPKPSPAEQASGEHEKHMAVLERLEKALPDIGINGWIDGVAAVQYAIAALSQRPVVDEAMVIRACNAYDAASNDDRPATYPWMHAALTAALAPQQPEKEEGG